jgi:hypothetical protein
MNVYFAYTIGEPDMIYYGKYFGNVLDNIVSEKALLNIILPHLKECYSSADNNNITISILSSDNKEFTERDPMKYNFVYCKTSSVRVYLNGALMS